MDVVVWKCLEHISQDTEKAHRIPFCVPVNAFVMKSTAAPLTLTSEHLLCVLRVLCGYLFFLLEWE